jgi:signal transduction histidine kinase
VIEQAIRFSDHVLQANKVEVVRHFADSLPRLRGVRGHLVQVFVNLMTNACHAMSEGGQICVSAESRAEPGAEHEHILMSVQDTGMGIDPANLSKIFEPFFTTKPEGKGSGLGLLIVQEIVGRHAGEIWVESEVGKGSTFFIALPAEGESAPAIDS